MHLRPYQQAALDALFAWWAAGRQGEDPLVCLPTAAGKTVIFCALIRRLLAEYPGVSVLILAHRQELISQAEAKLRHVWPAAPVGVYAASLGRREVRPITIASRDTIAPVVSEVGQFTFLIIDEAHRISVKDEGRYRKLISALRGQYEDLVVIGFTATPFRLGQGRIYGPGKPFADLAFHVGMLELIQQGYLAPLTSLAPATGSIDTEGVKTTAGDFNERQLEERATAEGIIDAALDEWQATAYAAGRQASVFFCVSILHAGLVQEALLRRGILAATVSGETPAGEREQLLAKFAAGVFPALCNVGVLTEGWDCPRTDCIVLLRPTRSAALYVQMVGRGLRLSPETGKTDCLILDFGGNIERLGPVDQADEREPKARKSKPCPACGRINEPDAQACSACGTLLNQEAAYRRCGDWDPAASRFVNGCGHKNPTAAVKCEQCGQLFIRHEATAQRGGLISSERRYEAFEVERLSWRVAYSQKNGQPYLRLAYHCGLFETFYRNLMIGYGGYAGQKAALEWTSLTTRGTSPMTPEQAAGWLDLGEESLRPPRRILVDVASRWKDIVRIDYEPDPA